MHDEEYSKPLLWKGSLPRYCAEQRFAEVITDSPKPHGVLSALQSF